MRRFSWVWLMVAVFGVSGCDQLAKLENPDVRIAGEWHRIEMSFPGDEVYDFMDRVIAIDGVEAGTYRFESSSTAEVVLGGERQIYEIEYSENDSKMIWYRPSSNGRIKAMEWVRAE